MKIKKITISALSVVLSATVLANSRMDKDYYANDGMPFVAALSVGPAWSRIEQNEIEYVGTSQNIYIVPKPNWSLRLVTVPRGTRTIATGELFLGMYSNINSIVQGQLGLAIASYSQVSFKGTAINTSFPGVRYPYSYSVQSTRVALKAKTLLDSGFYDVFPYLSGSAGIGFNHSGSFASTFPYAAFTDHWSRSFSYTLGIGLQTPLEENWQLGLGYEFASWGPSRLAVPGQRALGGIRLPTVRSQELQITISYTN